ncbi:MAG: ATP-binding cassette domain-containing protein, partial [Christensenellaceae bacterium]|nr:ATP-binding cassette domain-containing protein [Christensenellaceae bacterium]
MIEISGLYKVFNEGKPNEKIALENVNLSVGDGEMIAITGASGAGKSTLLNILGTLDFATKGNVAADDLTLSAMTPKELAKYRGEKV